MERDLLVNHSVHVYQMTSQVKTLLNRYYSTYKILCLFWWKTADQHEMSSPLTPTDKDSC